MRIVSDRCAFPPDAVMPVYQTDKLRHCLGSLFASLSERGWVNMLPMHERLFMGRPIVPRVRQVVNCLLFAHYLSVTWTRQGKGNSPSFHTPGEEQIAPTGRSLMWHRSPVHHLSLQPCSAHPNAPGFDALDDLFHLTRPSWQIYPFSVALCLHNTNWFFFNVLWYHLKEQFHLWLLHVVYVWVWLIVTIDDMDQLWRPTIKCYQCKLNQCFF